MSVALEGGFADQARDGARAFRAALDAMARPGRRVRLEGAHPPAPMSQAAGALALILCDGDAPLWLAPALDRPEIRDWLRFHTGAPIVADPAAARFAFGPWAALLPLKAFALGAPERPDLSATLIVERSDFDGAALRLSGPGVPPGADARALVAPPEPEEMAAALAANHALYPLGVDLFFTAGAEAVALPRSCRVEV